MIETAIEFAWVAVAWASLLLSCVMLGMTINAWEVARRTGQPSNRLLVAVTNVKQEALTFLFYLSASVLAILIIFFYEPPAVSDDGARTAIQVMLLVMEVIPAVKSVIRLCAWRALLARV